MERLVTASVVVDVPLCVDVLVRGNVDHLGLGKSLVRVLVLLLGRRGDGGSSNLDIRCVRVLLIGSRRSGRGSRLSSGVLGLLGGAGRRLGRRFGLARRRAVVARRRLSATHVEVHALVKMAGLGLDVIGKDVRHLVARGSVVARQDGAECVASGRGIHSALITCNQVVAVLARWAVLALAVNVGHIEVVELVLRRAIGLAEVLQLSDVVALALLSLRDLDGYTSLAISGIIVVLRVGLASLESDHAILGATITLIDGPEVNVVVATVDDTSVWLVRVAFLVQGDSVPEGGGGRRGRDHGRGRRNKGNELHRYRNGPV